jgi:hypothetical protein
MPQYHYRLPIETGKPPYHGRIIHKTPVAMELYKVLEDHADVVYGMGAIDVSGELSPLPRGKLRIDFSPDLGYPLLKPFDPDSNPRVIARGKTPQFLVFPLQFHERPFKIQIMSYHLPLLP